MHFRPVQLRHVQLPEPLLLELEAPTGITPCWPEAAESSSIVRLVKLVMLSNSCWSK